LISSNTNRAEKNGVTPSAKIETAFSLQHPLQAIENVNIDPGDGHLAAETIDQQNTRREQQAVSYFGAQQRSNNLVSPCKFPE